MKNKSFIILALIATALLLTSTSLSFALKEKNKPVIIPSETIETGVNVDTVVNVELINMSEGITSGSATIVSAPTIVDKKSISDYKVTLFDPGDYVEFTFDIQNNSSSEVYISNLLLDTPMCDGFGANGVRDAELVCTNISYKLLDINDDVLGINDVILGNETKTVKLRIEYKAIDENQELPETNVEISNLDVTIDFENAR